MSLKDKLGNKFSNIGTFWKFNKKWLTVALYWQFYDKFLRRINKDEKH